MSLTLVIGNKRYSSWSLRAWLAARLTGEPLVEEMIWLDRPETRTAILKASPAGRVPVLKHAGRVVWDSLAIGLYLQRHFPPAGLLPEEADAEAHCLAIVAEMHSGFAALRSALPMDLPGRHPERPRPPEVQADIDRIVALWEGCRDRFGAGGVFLFGQRPTLADCFYAPVATRFVTYGVPLPPVATAYRDALLAWDLMREWAAPAPDEPVLEHP